MRQNFCFWGLSIAASKRIDFRAEVTLALLQSVKGSYADQVTQRGYRGLWSEKQAFAWTGFTFV